LEKEPALDLFLIKKGSLSVKKRVYFKDQRSYVDAEITSLEALSLVGEFECKHNLP